ncbi:molybdopterin biosynthesis protein [Fuchsiella alkaliacetigena]|uniref:molybdopterin biosynthesis protein n=1 Tax=Fuchsiella alkaliacetigena TaxID=957042 RepID=UPI00200B3493|nr:molybdopterin biosynthesis protein [Fuchsiella alkaliacetigena]MCK8824405.1 molybdopterin biosynthesis protein [Fuchsiella alkaliacetigena]
MGKRKVYLDKVPLNEARQIVLQQLESNYDQLATETVAVEEALGRVNAEAIYAQQSTPHYYASAMDGVAVDVEVTFGASSRSPNRLKVNEEVFYVDTGEPIPEGCNGVIMIEDVNELDEETLEITEAATPGQHIRPIGEDILARELVLTARQELGPAEIGSLLAAGVTEVEVIKQPEVAILPTGTELIEPEEKLAPGKIVEYNSRVLKSQVKQWGGRPIKAEKVVDDYQLIKQQVEQLCSQHDLVLIIAGSSAGAEDYTAQVIEDLGELLFHGVAIKPAKPLMVGLIKEKLVIGVPGYPVSAYLGSRLFAQPLVTALSGLAANENQSSTVKAKLVQNLLSKLGQEEFVRVKLAEIAGELRALSLKRGAGVINSVAKADGFARIPALSQGLEAGEEVEVELIKESKYQQNLIVAGEQGVVGQCLENQANRLALDVYLHSAGPEAALEYLGSQAANLALLAQVEGASCAVEEYYAEATVVELVTSSLGLVVEADNPQGITSLEDLLRSDISFINQAESSSSRRLLDNRLQELQIDSSSIEGYARQARNELEVVNLIKEGLVQVGLVTAEAAQLLALDFIPLAEVDYKLVIPAQEEERLTKLKELLISQDLKAILANRVGVGT